MLSYRHAFHAGNHADVLKHAVQALIIESLKKKEKPFIVLDTHAGAGGYDLRAEEAGRTREAEAGILRLLAAARAGMPPAVVRYLAAVAAYDRKFGHIFIVCATGKSAAEMLALLEARMNNDPAYEITVAAEEQNKITRIRLKKLLA